MSARGWRRNVARIYAFKFLETMHLFAGVLIPFFTEWGGISFLQVMLLQSWFVFWVFLLEVPTGAVADTLGRKASLVLGALSLLAAVLVYASRPAFLVFLAAETLWALAGAFISGADEALVYDTLRAAGAQAHGREVLARLASCELLAVLVSAPLGGLIAGRWGLRAPLLCMTVPFALAVLVALTIREAPGREGREGRYWANLVEGLAYARRHPVLRVLAFDSISVFCLCFMLIWLFQPFLKTLGAPIEWYGFVVSASTGLQLVLLNLAPRLERLAGGTRRYLSWSAVIPGLGFLALAACGSPRLAVPLIAVICGFGLSRAVLVSNYINRHIDTDLRATVLSSVNMARQLTGAVLYPVVGWLQGWSARGTFVVLGLAVLASALASGVREEHLLE